MKAGKKLILIGGGGHCKAVIDVLLSSGRSIFGIIDNALKKGSSILGIPVIGSDDNLSDLVNDDVEFLITVGQIKTPDIRHKLARKIAQAGGVLSSPVIANSAHIAIGVTIGNGTVVMHNAIINTAAIIEHDCYIGNFTHISTGAIVNGCSTIGDNTFIGSHATIANVINIANDSVIGAGSVVINDITHSGIYYGVPTKP